MRKKLLSNNFLTILAIVLGICVGYVNIDYLNSASDVIAELSVKLMKLIALPLLFLSIISSAAHFKNTEQIKILGSKIVKYTVFTTLIAAVLADIIFWVASPYLLSQELVTTNTNAQTQATKGFFSTLLSMVPDNLLKAFLENNVLAVVALAILFALALLSIKEQDKKEVVFSFFSGVLSAIMRMVHVGIKFIPLSVFAFVSILTKQIAHDKSDSLNAILGLIITVISANLIQGMIILPIFLKAKKISPIQLFLHVKEALILAFFTRSSTATLPLTLDVATKNAKISDKVAQLALPLCTTINMNGCAQFILLSTCFVSYYTGNALDTSGHVAMIFLSVVAAIGNAGVPMGCFFLSSSILAANDVPLYLMGSILPLYAFIDMVETSLNVWSDVCIAKVVDKESSSN